MTATPIQEHERTDLPPTATDQDLVGLVNAGREALAAGDLRTALDRFQQVVEAFPQRAEGHNNLGALYSSLGEPARAEACFDRVVALLPHNPHVLYNRGVARAAQENHAGAQEDFKAAAQLAPDDSDIHNNLGVTSFLLGQPDDARRYFQRALQLHPDHANAVLNLCDLDAATGNFVGAIATCEEHLAAYNSAPVRRKQLELHVATGREHLDRAIATAEALLVADPENAAVRRELGRVMQAREVFSSANIEAQAHA